MDLKDKLTALSLGVALLAVVTKVKAFETWLDERTKRWLAARPKRQLARRVTEEALQLLLTSEREEVDTLCLLLKMEYQADRVTVIEFECPKQGPTLATCTAEERSPWMPAIRLSWQQAPLLPEIWAEILRIHALDCHCWYVPTARLVEVPAMRAALLKTGVSSAYYQTLPATPGHCGGLLSISWRDSRQLSPDHLAALHFSARTLAAVLRSIWAWNPTD